MESWNGQVNEKWHWGGYDIPAASMVEGKADGFGFTIQIATYISARLLIYKASTEFDVIKKIRLFDLFPISGHCRLVIVSAIAVSKAAL